ncbi:protein-tyrosine phosphatase [Paenibacillus phyllosphaerae]|uniref:Protein-tyrosine phosphatase n=1 Tax=Paenibacillus phyllosphaerae TaxID=274593 RepID=A0A7W5AYN0_9BACL|nr:tyrosine-protein phosphatase [Paenibacillus phyllosphaerae]MBB3110716.1 protein-tyrosine phosphatase [Paenibacillus phyllosphaerae]
MLKKTIVLSAVLAVSLTPAASFAASVQPAVKTQAAAASVKQGAFTSASVVRNSNGTLTVRWTSNQDLGAAKVYWSTSPEGGWQELARTYTRYNGYVAKDPKPGSVVYYKIKGGNGASIVVGERKLPLKGVTNFRDLGGYATTDGRSVKWGKLFRSDELAGLTAEDKTFLQSVGLKTNVDYRSSSEVKAKPDPTIPGVTYVSNPAIKETASDNSGGATDLASLLASGDLSVLGEPGELLIDANRQLVQNPEAYVELFDLLLDPANAALVQHCTAGKDRTGLGSALILLALGVPKETVVEDFLLSNTYRAAYNKAAVDGIVKQMNLTDEKTIETFKALMEVRKEYINAAFDEMQKSYGSIDGFLTKGLGLTAEKRAQLKKLYLN